jgi:hypothetical protein
VESIDDTIRYPCSEFFTANTHNPNSLENNGLTEYFADSPLGDDAVMSRKRIEAVQTAARW